MNFKDFYTILEKNNYYIFSFEDMLSFFPDESKENLKKTMYRWRKQGWIQSLKKGLYELSYPKEFHISDMYIANKLYAPSYVSLETALSNYSIIPEVSMAVTSVSTKPTRRFKNKHGLFMYRTIKPAAFTGYYVEKHRNFDVLIAEPEKAFIDYVYFATYRNKKMDFKGDRLDKRIILKLNRRKLKKYAQLFNINMEEVYANL